MTKDKPQILLTNDDGIESPGLWAAAEALSEIGYVWVIAPREQSSGAGRSMLNTSDGIITKQQITVHGIDWPVYAVGGTPAQTVQHGILEIIEGKPDLVVSGINYGLNLGTGITISGTVGAAMEGASQGIPSLAVSLDTAKEYHHSHSTDINFKTAAEFTAYFAEKMLNGGLDDKIQLIKIDVPSDATFETPWDITRLSPVRYYIPQAPERDSWDEPKPPGYQLQTDMSKFPPDSDVYTVLEKKRISVTPITLDMTARVDFDKLARQLED